MAREPVITVPFDEWPDSPRESGGYRTAFSATRTLRCAWDDRLTLHDQLAGGYLDTDTGEWVLPAEYPWRDDCRVTTIRIEPYAGGGEEAAAVSGAASYPYALLTVDYAVTLVSFSSGGNNLVVHRFTAGSEFLTRSVDNTLWWTAADERVLADQAPAVVVPTVLWNIQIHEVETVPADAYDLAGSVNQAALASTYIPTRSSFAAPIETLRYNGAEISTEFTSQGAERWLLNLSFSRKQATPDSIPAGDIATAGWNHFYHPGKTKPERMFTDPTDRSLTKIYKPYPTADLAGLLAAAGV